MEAGRCCEGHEVLVVSCAGGECPSPPTTVVVGLKLPVFPVVKIDRKIHISLVV